MTSVTAVDAFINGCNKSNNDGGNGATDECPGRGFFSIFIFSLVSLYPLYVYLRTILLYKYYRAFYPYANRVPPKGERMSAEDVNFAQWGW